MKMRFPIMCLVILAIGLFNTSCASSSGLTIRTGQVITFDDLLKMPPFNATVESVEISHPFIFWISVDIFLRKTEGGYRLDVEMPSTKHSINFARSLVVGQRYSFPQILIDYTNNHATNTVRK